MKFSILGPITMYTNTGMTVELAGPRQRFVLVALLLNANRVVTVDHLMESAWNKPPPSATVNIRGHIAALRKLMHAAGEPKDRLVTHDNGYLLRLSPGELDLSHFMDEFQQGNEYLADGMAERAVGHFQQALEIWQGSPLEGISVGPFLRADLERLEEIRLLAVEHYAQARLDVGQSDALIPGLRSLTQRHPFRERYWEMLITALYRMGRQAEALATYARVRRLLMDELGIDPMDRLQRLEEQILRGDLDDRPTAVEHAPPRIRVPHRVGVGRPALAIPWGISR